MDAKTTGFLIMALGYFLGFVTILALAFRS